MQAVKDELEKMALDSLAAEQAMPARSLSPFLAYHTHCPREVCPLAEREGEQLGARLDVILRARQAVQSICALA
jgi:hypothetical protein